MSRLDLLESQVIKNLSDKVDRLEQKIAKLESTSAGSYSMTKLLANNAVTTANSIMGSFIPRSCHELLLIDPTLPSGLYTINPGGVVIGEPTIQVFCDMSSTGALFI